MKNMVGYTSISQTHLETCSKPGCLALLHAFDLI